MLFYREHCPELNGRTAMVLRLCEDTGRWAVAIGGREASSEQRCIRCFPVNLVVKEPFWQDSCFPPGIDVAELSELVESVLADPALLARTVAGARAAPRRGYGPELSDHANVTLAALLGVLETADPLRIQRSLRHCATCESAWTALRLSEWFVTS